MTAQTTEVQSPLRLWSIARHAVDNRWRVYIGVDQAKRWRLRATRKLTAGHYAFVTVAWTVGGTLVECGWRVDDGPMARIEIADLGMLLGDPEAVRP